MVAEKPEHPPPEGDAAPPFLKETTSSGQLTLFLTMVALGLLILIGLILFS